MEKVRHVLRGLASDDGGAAAPEYGLLISVVVVLAVAGALLLGTELNNFLIALGTFFEDARTAP